MEYFSFVLFSSCLSLSGLPYQSTIGLGWLANGSKVCHTVPRQPHTGPRYLESHQAPVHILYLVRLHFLAHKQLSSHCVLTWLSGLSLFLPLSLVKM